MLSDRANRISLSPTLRIVAKAQQMRAQGIDVVNLSVGEPDFNTPESVKQAAKAALDANFTKYTPSDGIPDLKKAICEKLERDNGLKYAPNEIIVSPGAKNDLFNLMLALVDKGDDVLIPSPSWVSYPDQVRLAGAEPVFVKTSEVDGFKLNPKTLAEEITPNTKVLILNYPGNPTGVCYTREELEAIAEVCVREQLWVVADEIYEKLIYDGLRFTSIASVSEEMKKLTIVVNGFSKAYSMTGWRLGYAAGPREVIAACSKIQSHNTSNATSFVQKGGIEALSSCEMDVERMRQEFEKRRNYMVNRLRAIPGISCISPSGAFYLMPNVKAYLHKEFGGSPIRNSFGLAYYLLKESAVAVIPGGAFLADDNIRISFATSMEKLREGAARIEAALARLEEPGKARPKALNNVVTKMSDYAETHAVGGFEGRNELLALSEKSLPADGYFEWNASISGAVVQLRTNSPHLADFYQENFYPASLESDVEPHAVLYAVKGLENRRAEALLSPETQTAFFFNSAFYGQARVLALALAAETLTRTSGAFAAHCAALDRDGRGVLVWGAPGSGRTGILGAALRMEGVKLVASDDILVRTTASGPVADLAERKLYLKAKWAGYLPEVAKLALASKLENVVTRKDECRLEYCSEEDSCPLDGGAAWCPKASTKGRVMLDPYWLAGGKRHARRTVPSLSVIMVKDPVMPAVRELPPREAVRMLSSENLAKPLLHDPTLTGVFDLNRVDVLRARHEELFSSTKTVILNTALGDVEAIAARLIEMLD